MNKLYYEELLKAFLKVYKRTLKDDIKYLYNEEMDRFYSVLNSKRVLYKTRHELHYIKLRYNLERFRHYRDNKKHIRGLCTHFKVLYDIIRFVNKYA